MRTRSNALLDVALVLLLTVVKRQEEWFFEPTDGADWRLIGVFGGWVAREPCRSG